MARSRTQLAGTKAGRVMLERFANMMSDCHRGDHEECPGKVDGAPLACSCGCHLLEPWPWPTGD